MHCERDGYVITIVWRMVWSFFVEGCIEIVWLWRAYGGMRWVCVWFIFYQFGKWPSLEDMVANVSVCVVECVCVCLGMVFVFNIFVGMCWVRLARSFLRVKSVIVYSKNICLSVENRW